VTADSAVVALVGPTGSGKTALALALAARLDAEIVNCDSRQVYRHLDIGTAKPSAAERQALPHHLFDIVDPDEAFDCARYRRAARAVIGDVRSRGKRVLLVGGTGLYLKALRYGLAPAPPRDPALRARLAALEDAAPGALHARLARLDRHAAQRLNPRDRVRLIRALEVCELTGQPFSAVQAAHGFRTVELACRVIGVAVPREELGARLDARCRQMLDQGLVDEVRALRTRGYGADLAPLQSIGYREIGAYVDGRCDLPTALAAMQRTTRRFAKRQRTWFRADPTVEWMAPEAIVALG
jgi:tRNA dimethylallyltransferase